MNREYDQQSAYSKIRQPFKRIPCQQIVSSADTTSGWVRRKKNRKWNQIYMALHKGCIYYYETEFSRTEIEGFSLFGFKREFLGAEPYTESEFQARYRYSKESIQILTNLLNDDLKRSTNRSHAIPVETQIKIALRYSGSFMQVIGDTFGYDKSTVSRIIQAVTGAICAHGTDFLRWPDETTIPAIINGFYNIARFPCIIGVVDGTHIRIQAPSDNEYAFVNRKNFHSINVQDICDHEGKFTNIVAKWPWSTHDSFIFRNSDVGIHLDQDHRGFDVDGLLLGDSGNACKPYLMTLYDHQQGIKKDSTVHKLGHDDQLLKGLSDAGNDDSICYIQKKD